MVPWKPVSNGYFITGNLFLKCSIKPRTYHFLIFLFVTFLEANQQFFPQLKDTPHFRECHKWYTNSPFLYSHRWKRGWSWPWALTFCMEDPETPGKIQMERFIPVESFRKKKVIPFEVLPFPRFYRNDRNFLYHLFGLLVPGFMSRESEKFTGIL